MSRVIDGFINDVCSYIKYKGVHKEVKDELSLHIDELKDSYISKGLSEEDAEKKAIADMGNAAEIGEKLNKQHKPQTEWSLIILTAIISIFGILVMYVSSNFETRPVSFSKHILHVCVGVAALIGIYFIDYIKLKKHSVMLYSAAVFLLVFCMFFGTAYAGVKRWLVVGGFAISVNSVAGILFVSSFCGFLEKYQGEGFMGIIKLMLLGIGSMMLFVIQPSMSMVFMLFIAYAALIIRAISLNHFDGNKKIQMISVLSLGGISALMTLGVLISNPHRLQRLLSFWNNGANDPTGSGWIFAMADKVLKSSNLFGKGTPLAEGRIDWVMPEITTDFVLLNLINNFGWLVGIALVTIIAFFIVKMFITSNKIRNSFGFYLSLVSCVMLTVQFVISVLINFGLCPYIDVSLPFISYGGTNYLTNMIYVGLILSVWRKNNILPRTQRNINVTGTSIPRDTAFISKEFDRKVKLTEILNSENGNQKVIDAVRDTLSVPITYYAKLNLSAVKEIVDSVGGIELNVPMDMEYDDPHKSLHIKLKQGRQTLSGDAVCGLLQFRRSNDGTGYAQGDMTRIEVGQQFISEFISQKLNKEFINKSPDIFKILAENMETNYPISNLMNDIKLLDKMKSNIEFRIIDGTLNADETGIMFYDINNGEVVSVVSKPKLVTDEQSETVSQPKTTLDVTVNENEDVELKKIELNKDVANPVEGEVSLNFGKREHPITKEIHEHNGIDIKAPEGTDVVTSITGTVTDVGFDSEKGNYIVVENGNVKTLYAQLASTSVKKGDKVTAKQSIGTVGKTGTATGAHLHFEVMVDGEYVDPAAYIK